MTLSTGAGTIVMMLVAFVFAIAWLMVSVVMADFCYDAHANILSLATTQQGASYDDFEYFLYCASTYTPQVW